MANKDSEYASLRTEVLDYWKAQEQLLFATAVLMLGSLAVAGEKFSDSNKSEIGGFPSMLLIASVVHFFLQLILARSIANYDRIFRIGAYLRVFHDNDGVLPEGATLQSEGMWHAVWRQVSDKGVTARASKNVSTLARYVDIPEISSRYNTTDAIMLTLALFFILMVSFVTSRDHINVDLLGICIGGGLAFVVGFSVGFSIRRYCFKSLPLWFLIAVFLIAVAVVMRWGSFSRADMLAIGNACLLCPFGWLLSELWLVGTSGKTYYEAFKDQRKEIQEKPSNKTKPPG